MPPAQPLSDDLKAQVADYIRDHAGTPEGSVRAIADLFGIGKTSVGRIAKDHGLEDAWADGTARVEAAVATRSAILAQKRTDLQEELLDRARDLNRRVHDDVTEAIGTPLGPEKVTLKARPLDWKNTMQAVNFAVAQAVNLARLDNETVTSGVVTGLLDQFASDLQTDRDKRQQDGE